MSSPRRGGLGDTDPLATRPRRVPSVIPSSISPEDDSQDGTATSTAPTADAAVDAAAASAAPTRGRARPPAKRNASTKVVAKNKTQVSVYVDTDVLSAAKDAVIALTPEPEGPRNLSVFVEQALRNETARLAEQFNRGKPFPRRRVELQPGRPGS
jgi:uncharacterized protein (DUF4415 family)